MRKIDNFFLILFLTADINEPNFVRFMEDHLQRLKANNPGGKYDALIAALEAALNRHKESIDQRKWNLVQQEAETILVDEIIASFKAHVSGRHFDITKKWPEGTSAYKRFYPQGVDEYYQATKGNMESLINRWLSACDYHKDDLPAEFAVPFIDLHDQFTTRRPAQLAFIAATDSSRLAVKQDKEALALQATLNVHKLGSDFAGQPEMVNYYFDQSILRRPVRTNGVEPEPEVLSDVVGPKMSATILHGGFDSNTMFRIINSGSVNLKFYTTNLPGDTVPAVTIELAPGEEDEVSASELGADGNLFFMAYNASETTPGSYEITVLE
jgi:hypothetical protein